jgi:hypothetical protein
VVDRWLGTKEEAAFERYSKLALKAASDLADYQSPKFSRHVDVGKVEQGAEFVGLRAPDMSEVIYDDVGGMVVVARDDRWRPAGITHRNSPTQRTFETQSSVPETVSASQASF